MTWRLGLRDLGAFGGAVALRSREGELSYAELADRAGAVGAALAELGVGSGEPVALISAARGHDEAVGLVGLLAAGAVVVPLDVAAPPTRLAAVIASTGCRAVALDPTASPLLDRVAAKLTEGGGPALARLLLVDGGTSVRPAGQAAGPALRHEDLACILHTSGSTGNPKPVPIRWEGLDAFTAFFAERIGLGPGDGVLRVAELIFDLAWFDHLATFRVGATLLTMPRRSLAAGTALIAAVQALNPSVIYGVPSLFMKIDASLPPDQALDPRLRAALYAGEIFPPRPLQSFARRAPSAAIFNLFGPTETNVCTYHALRPEDLDGEAETPIGVATPYARCRLVGDDGATIEGAGVGELVVEGPTVAGDGPYPTRDRVERGEDGLYYFRGRIDRVVKIRGFRVDPGDVEAKLVQHPAVCQAAVVVTDDPRLGRVLVAYVALDAGATLEEREARRFLADSLPPSMIPDKIRVLDELPSTSTGKIDYGALR